MLAYHCNECGMPLFQYEGMILCPYCKRLFKLEEGGAVPVDEEKSLNKVGNEECKGKEEKKEKKEEMIKVTTNENINVKSIILSKLYELLTNLNECKDINCLDDILNISIKLLYILEKINKFEKI